MLNTRSAQELPPTCTGCRMEASKIFCSRAQRIYLREVFDAIATGIDDSRLASRATHLRASHHLRWPGQTHRAGLRPSTSHRARCSLRARPHFALTSTLPRYEAASQSRIRHRAQQPQMIQTKGQPVSCTTRIMKRVFIIRESGWRPSTRHADGPPAHGDRADRCESVAYEKAPMIVQLCNADHDNFEPFWLFWTFWIILYNFGQFSTSSRSRCHSSLCVLRLSQRIAAVCGGVHNNIAVVVPSA